ncbi:MAG TPA: hypothetical protein DCL77_08790 [Prolixibacteraceae bacterium]|nr:hypothetical protein [Prolixibacteraceae bacterium]
MRSLSIEITLVLLCSFFCLSAQEDSTKITLNGQVTSWGIGQFDNPFGIQLGGRFVPTLLGDLKLKQTSKLDFEASMNMNGSANFTGLQYDSVMGQLKPYRVWARYSTGRWEVRVGLQKINFGTAKLFRPLMWFDGLDVRDPLQLTDGVYGALGRYYFKDNANIWLWTLMGNKKPKGFEFIGTDQWKPEVGGRFQMPAGPGELAVSTNYRKVNVRNSSLIAPRSPLLNESRIGLDGKWDLGIGLWFESSVTRLEANADSLPRFQDAWNLGADYTFGIGNGLGVTVEYFRYHAGDQFLLKGTTLNLVGSLFTYPVSILDNLSAMVFYVPGPDLVYNYLSWSRTYDNWSLYAIGYWNPSHFQLITAQSQAKNLFAGRGIKLMVNYNF